MSDVKPKIKFEAWEQRLFLNKLEYVSDGSRLEGNTDSCLTYSEKLILL